MPESNEYLAKDHHSVFAGLFPEERLTSISNLLDSSDDWRAAQVTDNGSVYMVMPTIRRQKLIEKDDIVEAQVMALLSDLETIAIKKALDKGFSPGDIEVEMSQLIRSDQSDFFNWHPDSKEGLNRIYSLLVSFNDDFIGGEIELFNGEHDPILYNLRAGSGIFYNSMLMTKHHKVLRGVSFMGLCILRLTEEGQKKQLETSKEENFI